MRSVSFIWLIVCCVGRMKFCEDSNFKDELHRGMFQCLLLTKQTNRIHFWPNFVYSVVIIKLAFWISCIAIEKRSVPVHIAVWPNRRTSLRLRLKRSTNVPVRYLYHQFFILWISSWPFRLRNDFVVVVRPQKHQTAENYCGRWLRIIGLDRQHPEPTTTFTQCFPHHFASFLVLKAILENLARCMHKLICRSSA